VSNCKESVVSQEAIRIGLVVPDRLYREALSALLERAGLGPAFVVTAPSDLPSGGEVPDVVLVDCSTQADDLRPTVAELRTALPTTKIVVMAPDHRSALLSAFLAGADGLVLASISLTALRETLELVLTGERVYPGKLLADLIDRPESANGGAGDQVGEQGAALGLSRREIDVVEALVDGLSNREIAERLGMKESTVKVHLRRLSQHIGATNRTQIVLWALKNLLRPETEAGPAEGRTDLHGSGSEPGGGT
jgi:DNA-binding NarL/FixJ family response regulator